MSKFEIGDQSQGSNYTRPLTEEEMINGIDTQNKFIIENGLPVIPLSYIFFGMVYNLEENHDMGTGFTFKKKIK